MEACTTGAGQQPHRSGVPDPSVQLTQKDRKKSGEVKGVTVLDHKLDLATGREIEEGKERGEVCA